MKDHDRQGLIADPSSWDEDTMVESMERKEAEHNFDKINVTSIDPGKCRTDHGWDNWQIAFEKSSMQPWTRPGFLSIILSGRTIPPMSSGSQRNRKGNARCLLKARTLNRITNWE